MAIFATLCVCFLLILLHTTEHMGAGLKMFSHKKNPLTLAQKSYYYIFPTQHDTFKKEQPELETQQPNRPYYLL